MSESSIVLVTGAAGRSGSTVVRQFAHKGVPVRALIRNQEKAAILEQLPGVQVVHGDIARKETLGRALEGVEQALLISSADPQMASTQCRFIEACKEAGVKHVVKFSGKESGIGFDSTKFRFGRMHEEIEHYLEASGLAWTHLCPSQFMQVYLREIPAIAARGELRLPCEEIKQSPIDVDDIAKIAFELLVGGGHKGRSFEITGPEALTMAEIAFRIGEAMGKPVRYRNVSLQERRETMRTLGLSSYMLDALDEQAIERLRHPESRINLEAHELFDVRPTTFAEFAQRHSTEFRGKGTQI